MAYFRELPNLKVLNRTKNTTSNDETLIIKNFFKRAKLREDIASVVSAFEYYMIDGDERPEQVAEKIYKDPELDWVILTINNIINVQDQWPLSLDNFNKSMLDKYGSEDAYNDIHHYESISYTDSFGREVFPGGLVVDETFYNSPNYVGIGTSVPIGVSFPPTYIPGTPAALVPVIGAGNSIVSVQINNPGLGYSVTPVVNISTPPITINASAVCSISNFVVSGIATLNGGQGYNFAPSVTFSSPPVSVQATASCGLGTGTEIDQVTTISNLVGGAGYGITAPTITFSYSPRVVYGQYENESTYSTGNDVEGFYFKSDGTRLYTASFTGSNQIKQYTLSQGWDVSTLSIVPVELDVSADFSYTTGIEFKPDGTLMYVTGGLGVNYKIVTYTLSTAWNLSTASKTNEITLATPGGIRFKPDGTSVFVLDYSSPDVIKEFTLGTPWNLLTRNGTAIRTLNISSSTFDNEILGFTISDDGTKLFAASESTSSIYEFTMDTWEIDTAVLSYTFFVGDRLAAPSDIFVKSDRERFVVAGGNEDKIFQYRTTSTAKAVANVVNGSVSNITITQPGIAYTEAPTLTISAPYPAVKATGTTNLTSGIVTSITITNSGFGYTVAPTITIADAPISKQAVIKATLSNTGILTCTIYDGGLNYVNNPTITLADPNEILNVEIGETYSQNSKTWRWNGTEWEEKTSEEFQYFDPNTNSIIKVEGSVLSKPVTNWEYENKLNEEKRRIFVLKPTYLSVLIGDLKNIMTYDEDDPNYINDKLKRTYNEKVMGI
jgi:hypothetical protein